jgi:protein-arginine kinase activator protein McsA
MICDYCGEEATRAHYTEFITEAGDIEAGLICEECRSEIEESRIIEIVELTDWLRGEIE